MSQTLEQGQEVAEWQDLVESGNAAYALKKFTEAELKFAAALRIAEKWSSPENLSAVDETTQREVQERLGKSLNNMAALYHTQGKYKMAEDLYDRCLSLKIKLYGEDHLEVAINLHNLAAVHSAKRRWNMAEPLYLRSLEIRETVLGAEHADLVPVLNNYALMLKRANRDQEALAIAKRAGAIAAKNSK